VVQNVEAIGERSSGGFKFCQCADDAGGAQVTPRVIVVPDDQDSGVLAVDSYHQVVQIQKVVMVVRQKEAINLNCVSEMDNIVLTSEADIRRQFHFVPNRAEQTCQQR
jgi:hypothetical protein